MPFDRSYLSLDDLDAFDEDELLYGEDVPTDWREAADYEKDEAKYR